MKKPTQSSSLSTHHSPLDMVRTILPTCTAPDLDMIHRLILKSLAALPPADPRRANLEEALTLVLTHARSTGFSLPPEEVPA